MTTLERPLVSRSAVDQAASGAKLLATAVVVGLLLATGDLYAMTHAPYPWANLANSSGVWAISAFLLGAALRTDPVRAALAGVVMLGVAVEAYYGLAFLFGLGEPAVMWSAHARMWLVFGVIAGVAFGAAGAWTSGSVWWQRVVGAAAGAGILLGEAMHTQEAAGYATGSWHTELDQTAVAMGFLGLLVLVVAARGPRVLVPAALVSVPFGMFCAMAFTATGIGF